MKKLILRFREIATDGKPEKSGDYVVRLEYCGGTCRIQTLMYSQKHRAFNATDREEEPTTEIKNVTHWIPLEEFALLFDKEEQANA